MDKTMNELERETIRMLAASLLDLVEALHAEPATHVDYRKLNISAACQNVIKAFGGDVEPDDTIGQEAK